MYKDKILKDLQILSEKNLVKDIILPLLEKIGFESIEYRHGGLEKGIDILCIKQNELLEKDYLAIQVKKFKFSGNVTNQGHLYGISNQLNQCLEEPIKLKDGNVKQATRVWFISPYQLQNVALEVAFQKYVENFTKRISIIDGDKLYQLIHCYFPDLLKRLGDKKVTYMDNFRNETPILKEAATFGLKDKRYLSQQYVRMYLSPLPEKLINICLHKFEIVLRENKRRRQFSAQEKQEFNSNCKKIFDQEFLDKGKGYSAFRSDFNASHFINTLSDLANQEVENFLALDRSGLEVVDNNLIEFIKKINLISDIIFSDLFTEIAQVSNKCRHIYNFDIDSEQILSSRLNYQILADAGAGKTTLLRMIGLKEMEKGNSRLPVFISLSKFKENSGLLELIKESCKKLGMHLTNFEIEDHLKNGNILLLLDGIDEVASNTDFIHHEILTLMGMHEKTQFIFSARPWAAIQRNPLFSSINILPFTKRQIEVFFQNWFYDDKISATEINEYLKKNQHVYNIVSTPLIATIIAAIKTQGGKLPRTFIDVYSERLRLLLNDWDNVKGVKRDKFDPTDKLFFLRKLAFELHSSHARSANRQYINELVVKQIGSIHTKEQAEIFVDELINNNNILFKDDSDNWGFGHLQYQEYLVALELKENSTINKVSLLNRGWWAKVLMSFAYMTRDITSIIIEAQASSDIDRYVLPIFKLLTKAPNTDKALANYILNLYNNGLIDFNLSEEEEETDEYIIEADDQILKRLWEAKDKKI